MSDAVLGIGGVTVGWCHGQIGGYLSGSPQPLPDLGRDHDINVASYVCGFAQGQFLSTGHLDCWAKGDPALAGLGFSLLLGPWIGEVLGSHNRAIAAMEHLPQVGPSRGDRAVMQMDQMGGDDGIRHARGEPKQKGGLLRYYLDLNVEPDELARGGVTIRSA